MGEFVKLQARDLKLHDMQDYKQLSRVINKLTDGTPPPETGLPENVIFFRAGVPLNNTVITQMWCSWQIGALLTLLKQALETVDDVSKEEVAAREHRLLVVLQAIEMTQSLGPAHIKLEEVVSMKTVVKHKLVRVPDHRAEQKQILQSKDRELVAKELGEQRRFETAIHGKKSTGAPGRRRLGAFAPYKRRFATTNRFEILAGGRSGRRGWRKPFRGRGRNSGGFAYPNKTV